MKKIWMAIGMVAIMFFCGNISTNATEMIIYQLAEDTEVKEQADINSETIITLNEGTPIWILEEEQDWKKICYQDYTGYISTKNFNQLVSLEDLKEEFDDTQKVFEEIQLETVNMQKERTQELVWIVVVLVLVVVVVCTTILLQMRKLTNKKEEEGEIILCQKLEKRL